MQKNSKAVKRYVCVDGDMPLMQKGISAVVGRKLPQFRILEREEQLEEESMLLILCVSDTQRAAQLLEQYRGNYKTLKILLLYDSRKPPNLPECLNMGCCCVMKNSLTETELLSCIQMAGSSFFLWDRELAAQLLAEAQKYHGFIQMLRDEVVINAPTRREIDIAKCILAGMDNEDIGKQLYLSAGTIKNNIAVILEKYNFQSRAQIISLLAL